MADVGEAGNVKSWPQLAPRLLAAAMRFRKVYSALLVLVAWELGAIAINDPLFLPRPSYVVITLGSLAESGQLLIDIEASLTRVLGGFAIAMAFGVPLGIMMGRFRRWDDFWGVLISLSNPIPKIGLVPLFILWLGIGEASKMAVVAAGAFFPALINTYNGVRGVNPILIWRAQTLGSSQAEILHKVVLPAALPSIFVGARLAMALAWVILIAAEMVAARAGLGFRILYGQQMFETDVVFAGLLTISMFGFIFDRLLQAMSHRICKWYFRLDQDEVQDKMAS
jgi:ABC-type nitrate/sulfonate/bicarbonate transport system permease component